MVVKLCTDTVIQHTNNEVKGPIADPLSPSLFILRFMYLLISCYGENLKGIT